MASSVDYLVQLFRDRMDDNELPYLWDEDRIIDWFDEAQREFVRITHILKATTTLTVTTDEEFVDLPVDFLEFRTARSVTAGRRISKLNMNELEGAYVEGVYGESLAGDWMTARGVPVIISLDVETAKGRLVPIPSADDTITLYYDKYPKTLTASSSRTELTDPAHQKLLVIYAQAMAYDDQDSDTYDPKQATSKRGEFEASTAKYASQVKNSTRRLGTVRYGGY